MCCKTTQIFTINYRTTGGLDAGTAMYHGLNYVVFYETLLIKYIIYYFSYFIESNSSCIISLGTFIGYTVKKNMKCFFV